MNNVTNRRDAIWGYINVLVSMGANLVLLPFMIHFLDDAELGLWYVFTSFGAFGNIFDFSFSPAFARNVAYAWNGARELRKKEGVYVKSAETNWFLLKQLIKTCKLLYGVISLVSLLILISAGSIFLDRVSSGLSDEYLIAWALYLLAIFLNLYYGYYIALLRGVGAVSIANQNQAISKVIQIVLTTLLLFLGYGLFGACVGFLLYGIIYRLFSKYRFYGYRCIGRQLKEDNNRITVSNIKGIIEIVWYNTWREAVVSVSTYIMGQIVTVFSSLYFNLAETGMYSLGVQITTAVSQIARSLSTTYLPEMQAAYINKRKDRIKEILSGTVWAFIAIYIIGLILSLTIGIPIVQMLKPNAMITRSCLMGLFVCQFINFFPYCYTTYFSATNRIIYYKSYLTASILCILISYILLEFFSFGIWGLVVAQIVSQGVYNFWIWIKRANEELELSLKTTCVIGVREIQALLAKRSFRGRC